MRHSSAGSIILALAVVAPAALALPGLGAWAPQTFPEYDWCDVTIRDFAFASPATGVAVGSCMSVYVTTTGGATWKRDETTGDIGNLHGAHFLTPSFGMIVGKNAIQQPTVLVTTNGGASFDWRIFYLRDQFGVGNEGTLRDVRVLSATDAVAVAAVWNGDGAIARTRDGGASWTTEEWFFDALTGLDFAADGLHGVAVGAGGIVLHTADGGLSWSEGSSATALHLFDVDVVSPTEAYAVGEAGTAIKSTDGGATWLPLASGVTGDLMSVRFTAPGDGRVSGEAGTIRHTTDGGLTWIPELTSTSETLFALGFSTPGTGFAGGKETILRYTGVSEPVGIPLLPELPEA